MKITKVCCQGCGADLKVDESIRYVTCNYCNARLEVVHDTSTTHTRQLDKIEKNTDRMANNLRVIELQNDLERLDREWDNERRGMMARDKHGNTSVPSSAGSIVGGMLAIGFGIFWIVTTSTMGAPSLFPLFGLVFIGFAIFGMMRGATMASSYHQRLGEYESRRRQLAARLDEERGAS